MNIDYFIKSAEKMRAGSADHEALVKLRNDGKIDQKTFEHHFNSGTLPTPTKPTAYTDLANLNLHTFGGQEPDLGIKVPEVKLDPFPETSTSPFDIKTTGTKATLSIAIPGKAVLDSTDLGKVAPFSNDTIDLKEIPSDTLTISNPTLGIPLRAVGDSVLWSSDIFNTPLDTTSITTQGIPLTAVDAAVNLPGDIFSTLTGISTDNNDFRRRVLPESHKIQGYFTLPDEKVQAIKELVAKENAEKLKAKVPAKAVADGAEDVTSSILKYKALADAIQRAKEEAAKAALQAAATTTPTQTTNSSDTLLKYLLWGGLGAGALGLAGYLAGRNNNKKKKQRRPYAMPPMQQPMMQGQYPYQGSMQGRYPTY